MQEQTESNKRKITINALGTKFEITQQKLERYGDQSRLGKLCAYESLDQKQISQLCDGFDPSVPEFFFDRDPEVLKIILNYAITGEIHFNSNICELFLEKEFLYWMLDWKKVKRCCKTVFEEKLNEKKDWIGVDQNIVKESKLKEVMKNSIKTYKLWEIVSSPRSSKGALVSVSQKFNVYEFQITLN